MCVCVCVRESVLRATRFQHSLGCLCGEIVKCIQTFDSVAVVVVVVVVVVVSMVPGEGHIMWIILAGQHLRGGIDVNIVLEGGVLVCIGLNYRVTVWSSDAV